MAWWDTIADWWDGEDAPAAPVQGPAARPTPAPVDPEAQRAQQLIQRWRQQVAPATAPIQGPAQRPTTDPLDAALNAWRTPTAPVQGPATRPPANPWQAAVDSWQQGPPQQSPLDVMVRYDVPSAPRVDYALDRPDTGPAGLAASGTVGGQTQRNPIAPSLRAYGGPDDEAYYATAQPAQWSPRPFNAPNNAAIVNGGNAVAGAQMLGSGINAILNSDAVPGDGMWDKAGNLIGGAFAGAKGWFDSTAAGERFNYDVAQRAAERQKDAGQSWAGWATEASQNIGGAWGGLQDALARQTMGQGNIGEIGAGTLGSILTPVGELLNISQPTQVVKDTALNVASGLQAGQDLMNAIPLGGADSLPLGTALRSAADALVSDEVKTELGQGTIGGDPSQLLNLWDAFKQSYFQTQEKFGQALTPTAEQSTGLTQEELRKQQGRALLNWADPESVAKTFDALVDQGTQVQTLTTEAQRLYEAGINAPDEDTRQELWAQAADKGAEAYKLENTHPVALVNENTNIWAQMAFELLQPDLTDLAGGAISLLQLSPKARRLASTTADVMGGADRAADELAEVALGPQTRAAMLAETSDYNPRQLLDPKSWWSTGQSQAHQATDSLQRVIGNILTDIDTTGDAKLILRQMAEDPSKLLTGMNANLFQSTGLLDRATQDGLVRFGSMNLQNLKEPLRIFQQAAQTFLDNAESLNKGGPLINKVDFATEFVEAMNEAGYKFFNVAKTTGGAQASAVGELGKKFRSVVSPFYIYLSPGTWATNIIGGVSTALGDGTLAGGLVRKMDDHLGKLFGADPTVRGLEGAGGSMTQGAQVGGRWAGGQAMDWLKKKYSGIEENMSKRVYYSGTTHALKKVGRDILNNTLTPILTANGVTDPKLIRQYADHLFEVGYSGGNLVSEFGKLLGGQTRVFSLSNVNPQWIDALSPDVLENFYGAIRTAVSKDDAIAKLDQWMVDAQKYWDGLIAEAPTIPQRHVWQQQEVIQDTADLAQVGKQAQKYAGIPDADITAWKQATAQAMTETQRRFQTLMSVVADSANPQNRYALYNVWGALNDITGSVRARLGELAETAAQAPAGERAQRWGEYWTEAQRLWTDRNTRANDLLEKSAVAIATGEDFAPNLRTWDILERAAATNEQKLWDTLRLEPQSGAYDQRLAQVIEAGRGIADKAVARTYAAARRFVEVDAMDYIISAERNVQMAGAQARAYLDDVLEKSLKSGDWKSYYEIRNEVWRQLRGYERDTWGMATRSIVSDGLAKETTTGLRFDTGFDGVVELVRPEQKTVQKTSRLGAEKTVTQQEITEWIVKREDGTFTRYADAQVPQELKDRYRGVTPDEVDAQVQTELDNIASAHPFAADHDELMNAPTPPIRWVGPGSEEYDAAVRAQREADRAANAADVAAGSKEAREALRMEWDRIAKAEGGYTSIDQAIATYTRQGIVNVPENKFEDLYGKTIAGRRIENQNDVDRLLQEYYDLNQQAKSATAEAKVARADADATKAAEKVKREMNLGNAANQKDLQKVSQTTVRNTTAAGGTQAPELALAAMHAKEQLQNIYQYVRANLDDILTPKGAIGQGQNLRALDEFRRTVLPAWDNAKAVAAEYGNRMRSFTMVDFANNTRLDEVASLFFPYSFWFTRSIKNSAERAVFEPHIWRRIMQTENYIRDMREQRGDPARFDGAIPIDMGNGTTYYLRVSPAKYWPTFGLFTANDYADPESANNAYSMAMESLKAANFAPFPWMQAAGQVASNLIDGKPAGYDMYPMSYIPQGRLIGWAAAKFLGHNIPGFLRPGYYEYNVARELTTMVTEGRITPEQAQWAQDMLRQMKTGEGPLPEQAAMGEQLTTILDEATRRAADKELTSAGSAFGTGFALRPYDQDEGQALQASQTYRQREYNALTNPYGSEAAQNYTFEQYPELGPKYSQYGVMDMDQTRPGASAAKSAKIEQTTAARDGLYSAGDTAVDAMLQANPNATKDDIYQARRNAIIENASQFTDKAALDAYLAANPDASYVDVVKFVTDSIEQKYPSADLVQAGSGQKSYNPVEQQENFQAATLKQAGQLFPYPAYPGDGATAAEKAAYFKAKEEADRQRQEWTMNQLTTGGNTQLFPNWMKGSTALDNTALATSPEAAAALMAEDKTKYQTEAEQARLAEINQENEQKRAAGSAKQQEFANRRASVEGYFGPGGASMWDEYYNLPKGAARDEFMRNNPTMRAINLYAYNRAELAPALEMFGDNAFAKWALAPAYADTPDARAARSKYWDENPDAYKFNLWLNGRPTARGEGQGGEFRYNFGADWNAAKEMFGPNIWDTFVGYSSSWDKAQKRAYFEAHPELSAFMDWWYGSSGEGKAGGTGTARSAAGGRASSGGGGGGYGGGYQQRERPLVVNQPDVYSQPMARGLADVQMRGYQAPRADMNWMRSGQELKPGRVRAWSPDWIRSIKKSG